MENKIGLYRARNTFTVLLIMAYIGSCARSHAGILDEPNPKPWVESVDIECKSEQDCSEKIDQILKERGSKPALETIEGDDDDEA